MFVGVCACVRVCVDWLVEDLEMKCFSSCVRASMSVDVIGPLAVLVALFECQWLYSCKTSVGIIFLLFAGIKSDDLQAR